MKLFMGKFFPALIVLFLNVNPIFSDELSEARDGIIKGDTVALSINTGIFSNSSFYTLLLSLPVTNVLRIEPILGINESLAQLSVSYGLRLHMGPPPSGKDFRCYGGMENVFIHSLKYGGVMQGMGIYGFGGVSFFISPQLTLDMEFGGGKVIILNENPSMDGPFFRGGLKYFL